MEKLIQVDRDQRPPSVEGTVRLQNAGPRRLPIGAEFCADRSVHFRVWAPRRKKVALVIAGDAHAKPRLVTAMHSEGGGYFSEALPGVRAGDRYGFQLDRDPTVCPDPASRFQPEGPAGWSQIVDPGTFQWSDQTWKGARASGQIIYEMHVGTFTRKGTWSAAADELPELARAGMTLLEVMPVADFPGTFGWGYDGVCLFSPSRLYGEPDDFRMFVDRAHAVGLGVILDVVYNHFGNVDNSIPQFSADFRAPAHANEWGEAINFDGENSAGVREFFLANAHYWISEFHLDGLRFDATQAIHDSSRRHILQELVAAARAAAHGRSVFLVAENEPEDVRMVRSPAAGGHGFDAIWNDDFHHAAHVRLTGHNEAYYSDFRGSAAELLAAVTHGFLYQGQHSKWQGKPRGTPTGGIPAEAFVTFLQNHDQVANSGSGLRILQLTSPGRLRAMTALWLLAPQTPMFFQGQEFGASTPFLFFADNSGEQRRIVAQGRGRFLSQFPSLASAEAQNHLADPAERSTFERCRLDFQERELNRSIYDLHIDLLRLRREDRVFNSRQFGGLDGTTIGSDCLAVRFSGDGEDARLLFVNFGADLRLSPLALPQVAEPSGKSWISVWSSEDSKYGGAGTVPLQVESAWQIPGEAAVVLRPVASGVKSRPGM
jgi:maltooligosyltrehalose trehalohydrolase